MRKQLDPFGFDNFDLNHHPKVEKGLGFATPGAEPHLKRDLLGNKIQD
jgi:hypothetical protein